MPCVVLLTTAFHGIFILYWEARPGASQSRNLLSNRFTLSGDKTGGSKSLETTATLIIINNN